MSSLTKRYSSFKVSSFLTLDLSLNIHDLFQRMLGPIHVLLKYEKFFGPSICYTHGKRYDSQSSRLPRWSSLPITFNRKFMYVSTMGIARVYEFLHALFLRRQEQQEQYFFLLSVFSFAHEWFVLFGDILRVHLMFSQNYRPGLCWLALVSASAVCVLLRRSGQVHHECVCYKVNIQ